MTLAIGDSNLKDAAVAPLHAALFYLKDVGNYRGWLTDRNLGDWGKCASGGVSPRVVLQ